MDSEEDLRAVPGRPDAGVWRASPRHHASAHLEIDFVPTGTGAQESSFGPHVAMPDLSDAASGSSAASSGMLFSFDVILV
jgi:hypothetical protein